MSEASSTIAFLAQIHVNFSQRAAVRWSTWGQILGGFSNMPSSQTTELTNSGSFPSEMTQSDLELWGTWVRGRSRVRGSATSAPSEKHLRENEGGG